MTKNIFLLFALAVALFSCSPDEQETVNTTTAGLGEAQDYKKSALSPSNPANPFDQAGLLHNQILDLLPITKLPNPSLSFFYNTLEDLALQDNSFLALAPGGYLPVTPEQANSIGTTTLGNALSFTTLSAASRTSLENLVNTIVAFDYDHKNYNEIYEPIVAYESAILASSLSPQELNVILTITSIARYAAFAQSTGKGKGKGRDKDWRLSMGNITAASYGVRESGAKAIILSLASGLFETSSAE